MKIVSVKDMKDIEAAADAGGLSYSSMMRNAGEGIARWIQMNLSAGKDQAVLGLVGSGNNGGDTLVALACLAGSGWRATACMVRPRQVKDPLVSSLLKAGGTIFNLAEDSDFKKLAGELKPGAILLDGIVGTGTRLPLDSSLADALKFINNHLGDCGCYPQIVAVDCPSGVDCDSGKVAPETLHANFTLTMAAAKSGLLAFPAFEYVGKVVSIDIGIPENEGLLGDVKRRVIDESFVFKALPERRMDAHKGDYGTALLVVGSEQYTGAALLAGRGACLVGAGLVALGAVSQVRAAIAGLLPEAIWLVLPDKDGFIAGSATELILKEKHKTDALLVGCGWGLHEETQQFLQALLSGDKKQLPPLIVDADGLKLLARIPGWQSELPPGGILTPHPGEMAALTGLAIEEVQRDRVGLAERSAQAWNQVVVLKGALTVVARPDGQSAIIPVATSALARAGTGDILAGMITGLVAQGVDAYQAACAAAYLHGMAGMAASQLIGNTASVSTGDILNSLPTQISMIKSNWVGFLPPNYRST